MSRGNSEQDIYLSDDDRHDFLEKLAEVVSKFDWECYAYCLMDTHYHLLIETPQANLSEGMHKLNSDYCKRFNWKHEKAGHLFQERFNSPLIEKERHLYNAISYIALNPVKAGLVSDPGQWRWSSYRAISGFTPPPVFL
ncbi:MAG: transposase, partial [Actinobacteria bacterium]|nr:transposase [Actinomycetota bacterium]MBU4443023.1 transposase [Actinomycetota bacterium]